MDIFKKYIQDPKNPYASIPNPNYYGNLGTGQIGQKADTSFLQTLSRRTNPTTTSAMGLGEYLKTQLPQSTQYPSSQMPAQQTSVNQPFISAMQDRITPPKVETGSTGGTLPVQETQPPTPQTPFIPGMPDPAKTTYSQVVTKKGVYTESRDEFGNTKSTFLREIRPGDIFNNEEIYTWNQEWRPLSTEFLQGKGEMSFAPRQQFANLIKNQ